MTNKTYLESIYILTALSDERPCFFELHYLVKSFGYIIYLYYYQYYLFLWAILWHICYSTINLALQTNIDNINRIHVAFIKWNVFEWVRHFRETIVTTDFSTLSLL